MDDHQHQNHPPHAGQSINQYAQDMRGPSMGGPSTNTSLTQAQHIAASQQQHIISFWNRQKQQIRDSDLDLKSHSLPLARIKKVMKSDEDSKNLVGGFQHLKLPWVYWWQFWLLEWWLSGHSIKSAKHSQLPTHSSHRRFDMCSNNRTRRWLRQKHRFFFQKRVRYS